MRLYKVIQKENEKRAIVVNRDGVFFALNRQDCKDLKKIIEDLQREKAL